MARGPESEVPDCGKSNPTVVCFFGDGQSLLNPSSYGSVQALLIAPQHGHCIQQGHSAVL